MKTYLYLLTWLKSSLVWLLIFIFTLTSCASNPSFISSNSANSSATKLIIGASGKKVFDSFVSSTYRNYPVYRPNTQEGRRTVAFLQNIQEKYKRTEDIPENERRAGLQALVRVSNHIEENYAKKNGGFIVPPHSKIVKIFKSYCLDEDIPAPTKGEKMHLIKIDEVLKGKYLDAYLAIIDHAKKTGKYKTIQSMIWKVRKKAAHPLVTPQLNNNESRFITGANRKLLEVLFEQGGFSNFGELFAAAAERIRNRHLKMSGVYPIPNDHSEYTLLTDGVASRIISLGGANNLTIEIANNTPHPYAFIPTEVVAQSKRKVQRLGLQPQIESLILDFIPFIGNLKGAYELLTGKDYITGEKIDRWWAAAAVLAGGWAKVNKFSTVGKAKKGIKQSPDDWPIISGNLRAASKGKGNFNIGKGTREQANVMGKAWVGNGYTTASNGKILISKDGLRQYRPPSKKPNSPYAKTGVQSNYQSRRQPSGIWKNNGHFDITD